MPRRKPRNQLGPWGSCDDAKNHEMGMKSLNMHYSFGWPAINWQSEVGRVEKSNVFLCSNV
uniref:MIP13990p n=1 Tax=Drosophila melanogaster TaxID=7227 RepID=C9QP13_DROME|nr:MIP13990p [Drosophila melanogaster]